MRMLSRIVSARSLFLISVIVLIGIACRIAGLGISQKVIKDLPVYPNATLVNEFTTSLPDSTPSAGAIYQVDADPQEIIAYYTEQMPLDGWEVINTSDTTSDEIDDQVIFENSNFRCRIQVLERDPKGYIIRITQK